MSDIDDQAPIEVPSEPQPMRKTPAWQVALSTTVIVTTVGGALFVLAEALPTRTLGATRSSRLKWEQRQAQVDQAARDDAARCSEGTTGEQTSREPSSHRADRPSQPAGR